MRADFHYNRKLLIENETKYNELETTLNQKNQQIDTLQTTIAKHKLAHASTNETLNQLQINFVKLQKEYDCKKQECNQLNSVLKQHRSNFSKLENC